MDDEFISELREYSEERSPEAFDRKLDSISERISQFGTSVAQYRQFGTKDDVKAVASTWAGARKAIDELEEIYDNSGEYLASQALNSDDFDIKNFQEKLDRVYAHFNSVELIAEDDVVEDAKEKYGMNIFEEASKISQGKTEEYFEDKNAKSNEGLDLRQSVNQFLE